MASLKRKQAMKHNRTRAKIALAAIANKYKQFKMQYVNDNLTQAAMDSAKNYAAEKVASVRNEFTVRQKQIN